MVHYIDNDKEYLKVSYQKGEKGNNTFWMGEGRKMIKLK